MDYCLYSDWQKVLLPADPASQAFARVRMRFPFNPLHMGQHVAIAPPGYKAWLRRIIGC
jgi:hypothetical protein